MTDFRERIFQARDENKLKRLASRIPGIGQYMDKEMRREADKLLRVYIADQLEQQRKHLTEFQGELLSLSGGLSLMDDVETVQKKLQLLGDRLRTAVYGYTGWFDAVTIRENELNALYDYDTSLLVGVDMIAEGVEAFGQAVSKEEDVKDTLRALKETLVLLHEKVDQRRDVLIGAAPVEPLTAPVGEAAPVVEEATPLTEAEETAPVEETTPTPVDEDPVAPPN